MAANAVLSRLGPSSIRKQQQQNGVGVKAGEVMGSSGSLTPQGSNCACCSRTSARASTSLSP